MLKVAKIKAFYDTETPIGPVHLYFTRVRLHGNTLRIPKLLTKVGKFHPNGPKQSQLDNITDIFQEM